jgi:hypothetical protein
MKRTTADLAHRLVLRRLPPYRVIVLPWLRRLGHSFILPGWLAITIGPLIIAWRPLDEAELAHELAHVRQWREHGLRFIPRYLGASADAARAGGERHRDNAFEVEARAAEAAARRAGP